ncbi:MAG: hypothetical protein JOZ07_04390 [Solirubrobacterales bacterium]|nr:hypothetical protein [Solirubrobacterales bacterium]
MAGGDASLVDFLGVAADPRLLHQDLDGVPGIPPRPAIDAAGPAHARLVAAGSLTTAITLFGGAALAVWGAARLLKGSGGLMAVVLLILGLALVATHWGWVHVAEYVGVSIDQRHGQAGQRRERVWLAELEPYPRFAVRTSVGGDASTTVERALYRPVLTDAGMFAFDRSVREVRHFDADAPAEEIAAELEALRRRARLATDRQHERWEAAAAAYDAELVHAHDERDRLAARRAAAVALSDHLNASLREPPLVE